jgi:hypothetical protein
LVRDELRRKPAWTLESSNSETKDEGKNIEHETRNKGRLEKLEKNENTRKKKKVKGRRRAKNSMCI